MLATKIEYSDDGVLLEGHFVYNDKISGKRPAVLVVHDWSGRNEFAEQKAAMLAELGYVGFALDLYGKGKLGQTNEEKNALMQPLISDRSLLLKRLLAGLDVMKKMDNVDAHNMGAIGFCFGGLCVLDLARSGADLKGVVSFHGLLHAPEHAKPHPVKAKILAMHGYDDPMVKHEMITKFGDEMTQLKANWELDLYGNTMHGFTNPKAHDPNFGTVFSEQANKRSMDSMVRFFKEVFI